VECQLYGTHATRACVHAIEVCAGRRWDGWSLVTTHVTHGGRWGASEARICRTMASSLLHDDRRRSRLSAVLSHARRQLHRSAICLSFTCTFIALFSSPQTSLVRAVVNGLYTVSPRRIETVEHLTWFCTPTLLREVLASACPSVGLSVRQHISKNQASERHQIFLHMHAYGRTSNVIWRCRDTLHTSGFVDDVMFGHSRIGCILKLIGWGQHAFDTATNTATHYSLLTALRRTSAFMLGFLAHNWHIIADLNRSGWNFAWWLDPKHNYMAQILLATG